MNGLLEWIIFLALSVVAIVTAAGMIITMSMYRAGLALMASFVALAGLFILLNADLLAAIQVMMNVGGMLAMVLFMVMIMMDPGGEMMWGMKRDMHMPGLGAFSMHMPRGKPPEDEPATAHEQQDTQIKDWTCPMHPEISAATSGTCPKCGMALIPRAETTNAQSEQHEDTNTTTYTCPMHPEIQQDQPGVCPKCSMTLVEKSGSQNTPASHEQMMSMHHDAHDMPEHDMSAMSEMHGMSHDMSNMHDMPVNSSEEDKSQGEHEMNMSSHDMDMSGMSMTPRQNYQMMVDMAMSTAQLPWAIVLGIISALLLIALVILTPWPLANANPTQDATNAVGQLLLSRYMIGFEGAAFLIVAAIAGAVILAKREQQPAKPVEAKPTTTQEAEISDTNTTRMYTCPMHPEIRASQPGNCPKCGMNLLPVEQTSTSHEQEQHSHEAMQGGEQ